MRGEGNPVETIPALQRQLVALREEFHSFSYHVSHDLNAPLRTVVQFSTRLKEKYGSTLDERGKHYLEYVLAGSRKAQAMLEALLRYSRLNSEARPFESLVDMNTLAGECLYALRDKVQRTGATVEIAALPPVSGDPHQLAQMFFHLLDNALTFHAPGLAPRVRIEAQPEGESWRFHVADEGIGIDTGLQGEIFTIFRRLHGDEEYPGLGMGLALAHKIAERHGSLITVDSAPGKGARFSFTLPRARAMEAVA